MMYLARLCDVSDTTDEAVADDKLIDSFSEDDLTGMSEGSERHEFQTEASPLTDITVNSLYTDK